MSKIKKNINMFVKLKQSKNSFSLINIISWLTILSFLGRIQT
jgi:hypothetical protein